MLDEHMLPPALQAISTKTKCGTIQYRTKKSDVVTF
jgi:hypothetical protein